MYSIKNFFYGGNMKKIISAIMILSMLFTMVTVVGAEEEKIASVNVLQFDRVPDIDGTVTEAEWGTPTLRDITVDNSVTSANNENTAKASKLSFSVWLRYTYDGFYIALTTPDTKPYNGFAATNVGSMWKGDCLQFRLDPAGSGVDQGRVNGADRNNWSENYAEFGLAMGNDNQTYAYRWFGLGPDNKNVDLTNSNGKYKVSNDGTKTTYEAYIPWEDMFEEDRPHVGVSHGMTIGMLTSNGTDGYENWIEWGAGLFGGRQAKKYGSNRITYVAETVFGGAALTDPDPDYTPKPVEKAPDAEGDYVFLDFEKMNATNNMSWDVEDGVATATFVGLDPHVTADFWQMYNASADDYKYITIYMKSSTVATGRIYFTTDNVTAFEQGASVDFYCAEGSEDKFQVIPVDMTICEGDWAGKIGNLRFDLIDDDLDDIADQIIEVYAIGLYKNAADANKMAGFTVDKDAVYGEPVEDYGDDTGVETPIPDDETDVPEDGTSAGDPSDSNVAGTNNASTDENGNKKDGNSNTWIWILIAAIVVVVAVVGVVVFVVLKKKKN